MMAARRDERAVRDFGWENVAAAYAAMFRRAAAMTIEDVMTSATSTQGPRRTVAARAAGWCSMKRPPRAAPSAPADGPIPGAMDGGCRGLAILIGEWFSTSSTLPPGAGVGDCGRRCSA
jgi:hypothetical protein